MGFIKQTTRPIDEPLTGRRQGDTVGRLTEENTDAELGFQFLQRGTDGGLRNSQPGGRLGDRTAIGNSDGVGQLAERVSHRFYRG